MTGEGEASHRTLRASARDEIGQDGTLCGRGPCGSHNASIACGDGTEPHQRTGLIQQNAGEHGMSANKRRRCASVFEFYRNVFPAYPVVVRNFPDTQVDACCIFDLSQRVQHLEAPLMLRQSFVAQGVCLRNVFEGYDDLLARSQQLGPAFFIGLPGFLQFSARSAGAQIHQREDQRIEDKRLKSGASCLETPLPCSALAASSNPSMTMPPLASDLPVP